MTDIFWFYEMEVVEPFKNEPDDEIDEIALVDFESALNLLTHEEDRKILKYVFFHQQKNFRDYRYC